MIPDGFSPASSVDFFSFFFVFVAGEERPFTNLHELTLIYAETRKHRATRTKEVRERKTLAHVSFPFARVRSRFLKI